MFSEVIKRKGNMWEAKVLRMSKFLNRVNVFVYLKEQCAEYEIMELYPITYYPQKEEEVNDLFYALN